MENNEKSNGSIQVPLTTSLTVRRDIRKSNSNSSSSVGSKYTTNEKLCFEIYLRSGLIPGVTWGDMKNNEKSQWLQKDVV